MNFFITGNDSIKEGFNLDLIAPVNCGSGNFADKGQTLLQSYSIAANIFRLVGKDKINFVLIGLTADVLFRDAQENLTTDIFEENFQALSDYIKLCLDNGAQPVGVILPFAPGVRENYKKKYFNPLMSILTEFKKLYNFKVINFFDADINAENFSDETHLNKEGAAKINVVLTLKLFKLNFFSKEDFSRMNYVYFNYLACISDKEFFHNLLDEIFSCTVEKLRHKKKIKIAFVTDHAACWCGDELYNLFAQNSRFETTVFLIKGEESTVEDTLHDFEQLKSSGINVVAVFDLEEETPPQDIIFFLRPYTYYFSKSFQYENLTPQTLMIYIPYGFRLIPEATYYNNPVIVSAWKLFFDTENVLKLFNEKCRVGVPRALMSGMAQTDVYFDETKKFSFSWKMTRPDAKKIIWAPHHSFGIDDETCSYSTFHYNFKFMYEFAKAHPEISWVVKPHPLLVLRTFLTKLFPSIAACEEYLQAWNDLPNAQVHTGAYYQDIFATSDGMILDSISFTAEYQYTHKPMIYLLNYGAGKYNELGKKILNVSYVVDGKNFEQIADAIQKIFIEGNDPLKDERLKVFDEELNYYRKNGMTASEFIYKNVMDELREE